MAAVAFNKFNQFIEDCAKKVHNLSADSLKVMLTNTAPVAGNSVKADLTEITAANGYTAGGVAVIVTSAAQTAGTFKLVLADGVITAAGGSFGPWRYAVLYNDTPTSPADPLIGWWDYGASVTTNDTENFTVDYDPTIGVLQLA